MPKNVSKRSGITAREVEVFDFYDPEDAAKFEQNYGDHRFERVAEQADAMALEVLVAAGQKVPERRRRGARIIIRPAVPEAVDWQLHHAWEILSQVDLVRDSIWRAAGEVDPKKARERADFAAAIAFSLGEMVAEFRIKAKWERPALLGRQNEANLQSGRARGAEENRKRAVNARKQWRAIGRDLSKNSRFAYYTLEDAVAYIQKQPSGKKKNGKPYAKRAISDALKDLFTR